MATIVAIQDRALGDHRVVLSDGRDAILTTVELSLPLDQWRRLVQERSGSPVDVPEIESLTPDRREDAFRELRAVWTRRGMARQPGPRMA